MENQNQEELNNKKEIPASAEAELEFRPESVGEEPQTNKAYKFIVGFVITIALLIFVISTIVLLVKVVPNSISLVASTFRAIQEDQPIENIDGTQTDDTALFSVNDSFINSGETIALSWEKTARKLWRPRDRWWKMMKYLGPKWLSRIRN